MAAGHLFIFVMQCLGSTVHIFLCHYGPILDEKVPFQKIQKLIRADKSCVTDIHFFSSAWIAF